MNTPAPPPVDPGTGGPSGTGGTGVVGVVERLGFAPGQVVQEFGYDSDADDEFRYAVEDHCGAEIEDDDYTGGADAVLLWWRDGDGDLGDALVDLVGVLDDGGFVVLLTPKAAGDEVDPSDIDEAAVTAGLHTAGTFGAATGWRAHRLVAPRTRVRR